MVRWTANRLVLPAGFLKEQPSAVQYPAGSAVLLMFVTFVAANWRLRHSLRVGGLFPLEKMAANASSQLRGSGPRDWV